jgi:hypothetical protein
MFPSFQSHTGSTISTTKAPEPPKHDELIVNGTQGLYTLLHDCCLHGFARITRNHAIFTPNLPYRAIKTNKHTRSLSLFITLYYRDKELFCLTTEFTLEYNVPTCV